MKNQNRQHVFIIGCKGIPAHYGGFETFVEKLTQYRKNPDIQYHVACAKEPQDYDRAGARFVCHGAKCVAFPWRKIGPARAILYDVDAMRYFLRYAERNNIPHPIFYILACRVGPYMRQFKKRVEALGGELFINPDGHEFLRAKWNPPVRRYWKLSERMMVRHADLVICDSKNMETYIQKEYKNCHPKTTYIAYGAETALSALLDTDEKLLEWYAACGTRPKEYYLSVGRFVPENNYETMLREFMRTDTEKKFVLITDTGAGFLEKLKKRTGFEKDARICFAGTVYDRELLKKIRENAYGCFHGHEVGGTNPSLLEALASTNLNLLLDVGFNREVAENSACYWTKEEGDLAALIQEAELFDDEKIRELGQMAQKRVEENYSWEYISEQYEKLFTK